MAEDRQNSVLLKILYYAGAASAFIISLVALLKTMAPTLSFWDCGEFIACAHVLGAPHPPGTPLFVLLGKFFMLLGIFGQPALNTNFISVLSSAITVLLAYITIVKVSEFILQNSKNSPSNIVVSKSGIYIGALAGSLIMAFSSTFWFNAVETEVYGLSMMLMVLITYMSIKWAENKLAGGNDIILIAIAYLLFLSISIHLTSFLMTPAVVIFIAVVDREKLRDWRFWVCWGILFSFASPLYFPIQMLIPVLMEYQIETWMLLMVIFCAFFGYKAFTIKDKTRKIWGLYFGIMLAAIIGFTPHIYIPMRAAQKPAVNENNPDNWTRLKAYLERKQYGQESMITRMFSRRAKLKNQFGDYPHMGFWGYFKEQYSNDRWGFLRYLPFFIGLFGMYISLRKSFKNGFLLALIFLISSLGLILYLNFSDGTKGDQLEVRDRDYFYTPAFVYFAMIIGVGLSAILGKLPDWLKNTLPRSLVYLIWAAAAVLILLLPADTFTYHLPTHDRTGDFAPRDYAYNILNSCDENGIIFTNGDNDTFPLWYLQEVENVRQDVRVVNLSLLNTDWYIMQLKHRMEVPVTLSDEQILWEPYDRRGQIILYRPRARFYDPVRKASRYLTPFQDPKTGQVVRVQDQMIEHIVLANKWKYPIYFATSVPQSNRWTLADHTLRQAMALKIMPEKPDESLDPVRTEELIYNVYRYQGSDDIEIFKDENNVGLTTTYPERFIELAEYYLRQADTTKARQTLFDSIDRFPYYYQNYVELMNIYTGLANPDSSEIIYQLAITNLERATERWSQINLYWQFLGVIHYTRKNYDRAIECYETSLDLDPSSNISFRLLLQMYALTNQDGKLKALLDYWINEHPEDMEARNLYNVYKRYRRNQ